MESNDKLNKVDVKNVCYYFNDIIKIEDFNFDHIFIKFFTSRKKKTFHVIWK